MLVLTVTAAGVTALVIRVDTPGYWLRPFRDLRRLSRQLICV